MNISLKFRTPDQQNTGFIDHLTYLLSDMRTNIDHLGSLILKTINSISWNVLYLYKPIRFFLPPYYILTPFPTLSIVHQITLPPHTIPLSPPPPNHCPPYYALNQYIGHLWPKTLGVPIDENIEGGRG